MKTIYAVLFILFFVCVSFVKEAKAGDPLPSWNETQIKKSILNYLNDSIAVIPVKDRIAVFDMDGTIACEAPLWFEMYVAINGLNQKWAANHKLLNYPEYQYARFLAINSFDTLITNHWANPVNYIDSMVWKAYAGTDNEVYVDSARAFLSRTKSQDPRFKKMLLADQFYQPMLELIQLLKEKQFEIYVVSGSVQGVIWSICPQTIGLDRAHLIGTTQILKTQLNSSENKIQFIIQKGIFQPKDDKDGKSLNIYSHIGKAPVFAFGNTTGDFMMFHSTSSSKYPHAEYLLNHDDTLREYAYPPYHGTANSTWKDSMRIYHWNQVDMSKEFKTVWMIKK